MAKSVLNVEPRVRTGKGGSRKVRADGLVPAVVYGKGIEAYNLRVDPKALQQATAKPNRLGTVFAGQDAEATAVAPGGVLMVVVRPRHGPVVAARCRPLMRRPLEVNARDAIAGRIRRR